MMVPAPEAASPLKSDPAFARIKEAVISRTGLAYYADKDDVLARIVRRRIAALGLHGFADYLQRLSDSRDATEWDALVDDITIGETYFFRNPAQFDALCNRVIPECIERRRAQRRLRIWSAGCASGAEPYSIAILLRSELAHLVAGWRISILGTDISRGKLTRAEIGHFTDWDLRNIPDQYKHACFDRVETKWRLRKEFRSGVRFEVQNLAQDSAAFAQRNEGDFDIILCRNVLVYFDLELTRKLLRTLHVALSDGGWLVAGHAEPHFELANVFHPHWAFGPALYRKLAVPLAPPSPLPAAAAMPPGPEPPRPRAPALWEPPQLPEMSSESPGNRASMTPVAARVRDAPRTEPQAVPASVGAGSDDLEAVRTLANDGDWSKALSACRGILEEGPLNADAHYLLALILDHTGDAAAAEFALKRAIYLDRGFALAHYHLARTAMASGDMSAAERSLRNALNLLRGIDDADPVRAGEGLTAAELRELTRMQLRSLSGDR